MSIFPQFLKETKKTLLEGSLTDKMLANHFLKQKSLHSCSQSGQQHGPSQKQHITESIGLNYMSF